jgi:hypothetical protein
MQLPRVRLSLPAVLLLVAYIAIGMWFARGILGFRRQVTTAVLEALDGDERALARDLVSTAVLDQALGIMNNGFLPVPRLANATDPHEELRRSLVVETESRSHEVRLSIVHQPNAWGDANNIVIALAVSAEMVLGQNRVASRGFTYSDGDTFLEFTIVATLSNSLAFCLWYYLRPRQNGVGRITALS